MIKIIENSATAFLKIYLLALCAYQTLNIQPTKRNRSVWHGWLKAQLIINFTDFPKCSEVVTTPLRYCFSLWVCVFGTIFTSFSPTLWLFSIFLSFCQFCSRFSPFVFCVQMEWHCSLCNANTNNGINSSHSSSRRFTFKLTFRY